MITSVTTYGDPNLFHTQSRCTRCVSNVQVKPRVHVYMYRHLNCCAKSCFHSIIHALKIKLFYEVNQYSVQMYLILLFFALIKPIEIVNGIQDPIPLISINIVINLKCSYDPWMNNYLLWVYESFPHLSVEQFCHNFNICTIRISKTNYWCERTVEIKL